MNYSDILSIYIYIFFFLLLPSSSSSLLCFSESSLRCCWKLFGTRIIIIIIIIIIINNWKNYCKTHCAVPSPPLPPRFWRISSIKNDVILWLVLISMSFQVGLADLLKISFRMSSVPLQSTLRAVNLDPFHRGCGVFSSGHFRNCSSADSRRCISSTFLLFLVQFRILFIDNQIKKDKTPTKIKRRARVPIQSNLGAVNLASFFESFEDS